MKLSDMKKSRPGPTPPAATNIFGGQDKLPIQSGQLILTDLEEKQLAKFGWKKGDALPSDLASLIDSAKAEHAAEEAQPKFPDSIRPDHKVALPKESQFENLSPEKQREIQQALKSASDMEKLIAQRRASQVPEAGQGVNDAINAALATPLAPPVIVDDLAPKVSSHKEEESEGAGGAPELKECPHCGFDLSQHDDLPVTDEDKRSYLISIRGQKRHRKRVSLMGGSLVVVFRSLTSLESDMAHRQISIDGMHDLKSSIIQGQTAHWRNLMTYRLIMGLESIWTPETGVIEVDEVGSVSFTKEECPSPNTVLYAWLPAVLDSALPMETTRRIVGDSYHQFQLVVEKMEANAANENFWPAIESQL